MGLNVDAVYLCHVYDRRHESRWKQKKLLPSSERMHMKYRIYRTDKGYIIRVREWFFRWLWVNQSFNEPELYFSVEYASAFPSMEGAIEAGRQALKAKEIPAKTLVCKGTL